MFKEIMEARVKKPGDPNAKCSYDTKKTKQDKKDKKHKSNKNQYKGKNLKEHYGVQILDEVVSKNLKSLETYANLKEDNITIGSNNIKFTFENSLRANRCQIVKYHDKYIIEFRKITDNLLEGKIDQLVFEDIIKAGEFMDVFEKVTGIYCSW